MKKMANRKIWLGMLAMALTFVLPTAGYGQDNTAFRKAWSDERTYILFLDDGARIDIVINGKLSTRIRIDKWEPVINTGYNSNDYPNGFKITGNGGAYTQNWYINRDESSIIDEDGRLYRLFTGKITYRVSK